MDTVLRRSDSLHRPVTVVGSVVEFGDGSQLRFWRCGEPVDNERLAMLNPVDQVSPIVRQGAAGVLPILVSSTTLTTEIMIAWGTDGNDDTSPDWRWIEHPVDGPAVDERILLVTSDMDVGD